VLQDLCDEDEQHDHDRRERLADGERRDERNRHRQLHRHAPLAEGLERLLVDGVAAGKRRGQRHHVDREEGLPWDQPRHRDGNRHESDTNKVGSLDVIPVRLVLG
jgi:hypothetical protein